MRCRPSDDRWIPYIHISLSIQLSWTSTPPCSLRSTITWAYHLLHLRSHIHDWIFLSPFCICFLYMIHVLYSEIVCTSCLYLVLNSLSLYKHHFLILFPFSRFLWFLNHVDALTRLEYHITIRYIIPSSSFSIETLGTMFISVGGRVEEVSISYFS